MHPAPPRRQPDRLARQRTLAAACCAGLLLVGGCATETRVTYDGWGLFKEMGDPKATGTANAGGAEAYTILLERFVGRDRLVKAQNLSEQLGRKGLPDVHVQDAGGFTTVSVGRFTDAGSPRAQALLRKVRNVEVSGNRLFSGASFVAAEGGRRIYDPLDLKQYPGRHTLQIGFYDERFDGDRRAAAEEAARILREDGAEAYFYHGPHRSLVCVGLFSDADFEQAADPSGGGFTVQRYGPRIRDLQDKFPHNLGNGLTLIEKNKQTGERIGEQPSCLVRVM